MTGATKPTGPGLVGLILGPIVSLALIAGAARIALVSCTETVDLLEGPGEPAVVVASEIGNYGRRDYLFIDVRSADGRLWSAKCDPTEVPMLPTGRRTTMYRSNAGAEQGMRYAPAFIAEQRADVLSDNRVGRGILLYGIIPLILVVASWAHWKDLRTYRTRRRQA